MSEKRVDSKMRPLVRYTALKRALRFFILFLAFTIVITTFFIFVTRRAQDIFQVVSPETHTQAVISHHNSTLPLGYSPGKGAFAAGPVVDAQTQNQKGVDAGGRPDRGGLNGRGKITMIAIWGIRASVEAKYLLMFFHSVQRNPEVTLLLLEIVTEGTACPYRSSAPNVNHVCLTQDEFYTLHVDFFCQKWRCTPSDRPRILEFLKQQGKGDKNHSYYRILRGAVFARYLEPDTSIWGWCDSDTYWGNFNRVFPWDIAHDFDVISVAWQKHDVPQHHLFLRGHMAFFNNRPSTHDKLASYPSYSSFAFLKFHPVRTDGEESYLSHYIFSENTDFTFLVMEGLPWERYMIFFTDEGTFCSYTQIPRLPANKADGEGELTKEMRKRIAQVLTRHSEGQSETFTSRGDELETTLLHDGSLYKAFKWFPDDYITYAEPGWERMERKEKAYFLRRQPGEAVMQRLEPRDRYFRHDEEGHGLEGRVKYEFDESLYVHFQHDKNNPYFQVLYDDPFEGGNINAHWGQEEGAIWDLDGNVIDHTTRASSL